MAEKTRFGGSGSDTSLVSRFPNAAEGSVVVWNSTTLSSVEEVGQPLPTAGFRSSEEYLELPSIRCLNLKSLRLIGCGKKLDIIGMWFVIKKMFG
jgi:hypothetical protein